MTELALAGVGVRRGGRPVLHDVSLAFAAGLTALIGPNGAGKSTLLAVAAGLLAPDLGSVRLDGRTLREIGRRELARRRAYLPQSARAEWPISVDQVVALGLAPSRPTFGPPPAAFEARIDAALAAHDLQALRRRPATELSGGELARTMLARATVGDPELLLADEPTAGLDPRHALDAGRRLRALADKGCTVVAAVHDLDLAFRIADRVVALKGGRVLGAGSAAELLEGDLLDRLYDARARIVRDEDGVAVRFVG